jgi:hypothetical protein
MKGTIFVLLLICLMLNSTSYTQEAKLDSLVMGWNKIAVGKLNFTQTSFDNWTQGGENSWAWLFNFIGAGIYKRNQYTWTNNAKFEYGKSKAGDDEAKKSADEIYLATELARHLKKSFNAYLSVTGRSQFANGYDYTTDPKTIISKFMNPGYFIESAGLKYQPVDYFDTRLGVALKQTVVTEEQFASRYTDNSETSELEKLRNEVGLESYTSFAKKITKTAAYATSLEIFSNLKGFDEIDVRWDNLLTAEVIKYISFSFNFQLYYDKDLSSKRQIKQYLGIGLTYTLL